MAETEKQQEQAIHLNARDEPKRRVLFTPADEDRFVLDCDWVTNASKLGLSMVVWRRELHQMLSHVKGWSEKHDTLVRASLAMQRDDQIAVCVVPAAGKYDFELAELLTALDFELAQEFQQCPCDVLQMPGSLLDDLEQRLEGGLVFLIYAHDSGIQNEVAT